MNAKDKQMIDDFLKSTEPKGKKHYKVLTKKERELMKKAARKELITECIVLAIVILAVVATLGFIMGKLNG